MSTNYFECDGCGLSRLRIDEEYPIDGQSFCSLCATEKVWYTTVKENKNSENDLDKKDAFAVLTEHSIFTDTFSHLRAYETAVRAMSQLLQLSSENRIKIEDMQEFTKKYKADLENDILPVLKSSGIIEYFDDDIIKPSELLNEIVEDFARGETDIGIKKMDGLVSIAILGETKYRSKVRRIFLEAVKKDCLDLSSGDPISTELTDRTLIDVAHFSGASEKQIMNQKLKMLKYNFFFESQKSSTREIVDPRTNERTKVRIWTVKEPWIRTISKVHIRMRDLDRERVLKRQ
ncbi:MAG: hypothetical protein HeimC3_01420 [Candidatus Heimdallarchaeota archaeon LC_3]|nr:MAG: hypothetical protein HeimC3_01420 [Candidatus Heimdallarchaeota archaeon LC_3]